MSVVAPAKINALLASAPESQGHTASFPSTLVDLFLIVLPLIAVFIGVRVAPDRVFGHKDIVWSLDGRNQSVLDVGLVVKLRLLEALPVAQAFVHLILRLELRKESPTVSLAVNGRICCRF